MHCPLCGWTFRGGGYLTKKEAKQVEKEQKQIHLQIHKSIKSVEEFVDPETSLQIERDFHAAEIPHAFAQVAPTNAVDRPTTTSTTYVDVTGASIAASNFTSGRSHLVIVSAQVDSAANNVDVGLRLVQGAAVYASSEASVDPPLATTSDIGHRMVYSWWASLVPTSTEAAEPLKLQFKTASATAAAGIDLVTMSLVKLSPDLTQNTDFFASGNANATSITAENTDTTTNNASISFTPATNGNRWLILSRARFSTGIRSNTGVNTRIVHSGGASSSVPEMQQEGEDTMTDSNPTCMYILNGMRVDTLSNTSQTYTEVSRAINTDSANPGVSATRTNSAIFALNLDKLRDVTAGGAAQEDSPQEDFSTTTPYGQLIHSASITPSQTGDVLILGHVVVQPAVSGTNTRYSQMRMQVDNADQPPNQTSKEYKHAWWDGADKLPMFFSTIENLSAASHTIDIDGNAGETGANRATLYRSIAAVSMEMQGTARVLQVTENMNITESPILKRGVERKFQVTENLSILEQNVKLTTSSSSNILVPENLQLWLSGGAANTDPAASIGGARSTTVGAAGTYNFVPADFVSTDFEVLLSGGTSGLIALTLFDNVLKTEAETGDTEYRCFYVYNAHPSLTMVDVRIWISTNTPAPDVVHLGLGTSAVNGTEQTVADENTAPDAVGFTIADSFENAIQCGDIPAGQHRAVWVKRIVDPSTGFFANNNYFLSAHFWSNYVSSSS